MGCMVVLSVLARTGLALYGRQKRGFGYVKGRRYQCGGHMRHASGIRWLPEDYISDVLGDGESMNNAQTRNTRL